MSTAMTCVVTYDRDKLLCYQRFVLNDEIDHLPSNCSNPVADYITIILLIYELQKRHTSLSRTALG